MLAVGTGGGCLACLDIFLSPIITQQARRQTFNFIAGRPKVALLFWLFSDFRCGVLLFMVILVIYKYKNR